MLTRWWRTPFGRAACLFGLLVGLMILLQVIALASGAPLPEGWMLSTGPLP